MTPKEEVYQKLRQWQKALSLNDSDTGLISAVPSASRLQPKPRQNDLKLYEQLLERMLAEAQGRQSSLKESDRHELQALQQVLNIPDENVAEIEHRLTTQSAPTVLPKSDSNRPSFFSVNPSTEHPVTQVPATQVPATQVPATQVPATQAPTTQTSTTQTSTTQTPATQTPTTQTPATEPPATQAPATQVATTEPPATETPSASAAGELNQPANLTGVKGQMIKRKLEIDAANTSANAASVDQSASQEPPTGTTPAAEQPIDSVPASSASSSASSSAQNVEIEIPSAKVKRDRRPLLITLALLLPLLGLVGGIWLALRPYLKLDSPPVDPKVAQQWVESGTKRNQQGQYAEAIKDFDQAIRFNTQDANAYLNRGFAQHRMGNLNAAADDYSKALTLNNRFAEAFSNRSHVRFDQGRPDAAMEDASQAIALQPQLAVAHLNLGNALFAKGNLDGAFQKFSQTLQLNPSNLIAARAHNNQGNVFASQKKFDEAIQAYTQAIQLDVNYADAVFNRALAFEQKGNRQGTIDDFRAAAKLYQAAGNKGMTDTANRRIEQLQKSSTPAPNTQAI